MDCTKRNVHLNFPCAGRQFKVGNILICVDPSDRERAGQSVYPNSSPDARILHRFHHAIVCEPAPDGSVLHR